MTRRLLLSYLTIAFIVLLVLEVPLGIFYRERETDRLAVDVERDAIVLAGYYQDALKLDQPILAARAMRYARRTDSRVVIVDRSGRSLVDTAGASGRDFTTRPEMARALAGHISAGTRFSRTLGTELLYVAVPVASGGSVHGVLRLTLDTNAVAAQVHQFWLGLAAVGAVILAAVTGIGWAIARSVNRPLRSLEAAATRFATGDLSPAHPDRHAPDEILALGETMNAMARRLDQLLQEHKAFVADASHQLRTPLTALRLRLENLQSEFADAGSEGDLAAAVDETDRLSALVNDLLRLARAEQTAAAGPVDLVRVARERVDTWSAMADTAGVAIHLAAPTESVVVREVPSAAEQILDNLIDNAIGASPPRSSVRVEIRCESPASGRYARDDGSVRSPQLIVADQGPGLSDEEKARALERFWRRDRSRPGTGLGLPIARALAEASGGSLALSDGGSGGLVVTVTLPAANSETQQSSRSDALVRSAAH